jgi:hypothetical protein
MAAVAALIALEPAAIDQPMLIEVVWLFWTAPIVNL